MINTVGPQRPHVGACWRPWGFDALATITAVTATTVTVQYDHDPTHAWDFTRLELAEAGRIVNRRDYTPGRRTEDAA